MLEMQILREGIPLVPDREGIHRTLVGNHTLSIANAGREPMTISGFVDANHWRRERPLRTVILEPGHRVLHTFCPEHCTTVHLEWKQGGEKVTKEIHFHALYENAFVE